MSDTKKCSKCGEVKGLGEFTLRKSAPDGRQGVCKLCRNSRNRAWRETNPASVIASRERRDPDYDRAYSKRQRLLHPQRSLEQQSRVRNELRASYVARQLGMSVSSTTPELIALKREQLAIKRMARELKKAATKATGENE